ncbi:Colanic acid biosynthesis protein [Escherichia coli]|nr:Colanic acid biosynthesis protein [Escherichia coli]
MMDELNDLEMGKILGACELTVGTRLHSAIISMNFATPAIAINYEHKSAGLCSSWDYRRWQLISVIY